MSQNIWTECGAEDNLKTLDCTAWRVVEDQYRSSTIKLVDTPQEQELLEDILEEAKPPIPKGMQLYHYLLFTPFRYPPLRHGSRFGRQFERGIWYGAISTETALAEAAFYRFYFLEGSAADLTPLHIRFVVFPAAISTDQGVDLTASAFADFRLLLAHPCDYTATQLLGSQMRASKVTAFVYPSARDPRRGKNIGVFAPEAFESRNVSDAAQRSWSSTIKKDAVVFRRGSDQLWFRRDQFLVDGRLPRPSG